MIDVKALITLWSGKKVELPTPKPHVEEEEEEETKNREEIKGKKKDISEGKKDHDSTMNANLEKELIDSCPIGVLADSCLASAP